MASHSFGYKGHDVAIVVDGDGAGRWTWSYAIDGKPKVRGPLHAFPAQAQPLVDALEHAKETIDNIQ